MKFLSTLLTNYKKIKENHLKTLDRKQEILIKLGREQFKNLLEKGLSVPVVFL